MPIVDELAAVDMHRRHALGRGIYSVMWSVRYVTWESAATQVERVCCRFNRWCPGSCQHVLRLPHDVVGLFHVASLRCRSLHMQEEILQSQDPGVGHVLTMVTDPFTGGGAMQAASPVVNVAHRLWLFTDRLPFKVPYTRWEDGGRG